MNDKILGLKMLLNEAVNNGVFPGANVVVVCKDKDPIYLSVGKKSLFPEEEDNDIDTLYDMASCTKVVCTTTCIFKLLEVGKLRLYDSISIYIPEFPYKDIVVWDLMTHSSGLPAGISGANSTKSKEELLNKIWNIELKYSKNEKIVYSDIGYILLGILVERISGETLDEFARKNVFEPLEMFSTGFNPKDVKRCAPTENRNDMIYQGIVRGKVHDENAYIMNGVAGHAGLFSSVKDLEHFISMILHNGAYKNIQFLSPATVDLMYKVQVRVTNGVSLDYDQRGLGWIVRGDYCAAGDLVSEETIHHTGFTGTNVFIDRINMIGMAMLSNRVHPTRNNMKLIPLRAKIGNYVIAKFGGRNEY